MYILKRATWLIMLVAGISTTLLATHEFGHLLAARMLGVRVEAFSIFFGSSILHVELGGIEWRLGYLPLGAYVELNQVDFEAASKIVQTVILLAGPVTNLIIMLVIFAFMLTGAPDSMVHDFDECMDEKSLEWYGPIGLLRVIDVRVKHFGLGGFACEIAKMSAIMGVGNIIPIPPMDGGKVLFTWIDPVVGSTSDGHSVTLFPFVLLGGLLFLLVTAIRGTIKDIRNWKALGEWQPT